jgi:hypothetical protein
MEIGTLWMFQTNSEMNKITDVTTLIKVDDIPAVRTLNPVFKHVRSEWPATGDQSP